MMMMTTPDFDVVFFRRRTVQSTGHDLKETLALNGAPTPGWPYPASMYYPYDPTLAAAAYPFGG